MQWQPIETAPKDGTWILAINNRGNPAVIIWDEEGLDRLGGRRPGWIHPFSEGYLSPFWNGGCGSLPEYWMPIPWHPKHAEAPYWDRLALFGRAAGEVGPGERSPC